MNRHVIAVVGLTFFSFLLRIYKLEVPDRMIGDEYITFLQQGASLDRMRKVYR